MSSQICPIIDNCRPFSQLVFSSSVFFYVWNIPDLLSHNFAPCPCPPPCTWWHTVLTLTIMTDFPSAFCTMASLACWTASLTMVILISIRRSAVETVSRAADHHFRNLCSRKKRNSDYFRATFPPNSDFFRARTTKHRLNSGVSHAIQI